MKDYSSIHVSMTNDTLLINILYYVNLCCFIYNDLMIKRLSIFINIIIVYFIYFIFNACIYFTISS